MWRRLFLVVSSLVLAASCAYAQGTSEEDPQRCSSHDLEASLPSNYRTYSEALELGQILSANGVTIKCMLRSKMESLFHGVAGAALYRSNVGDFEVVFLPTPQDVTAISIIEQRQNGRYIYLLLRKNQSKGSPVSMNSPRPVYFIEHGNGLLIAYDERTAASLRAILSPH
jgi:hypothetical protein